MNDSLFSVEGQVVLVSGGSRGIGKAIAAGFVERGATVIITGRNKETLVSAVAEIGESATGEVCDVASKADIDSLVDAIQAKHQRIDTLVNVAGVNRRKAALDVSEEDYDYILDINLKGAFLLAQAVGRHQVARGSGCQINVASLNTDRPLVNVAPYAMSKAGLSHMTRSMAAEWGPHGVRVNALAPGFILTDLTQQLWSLESMKEWGLANTPQRRLGKPEDMVGTTIFLASAASDFMTGQTLYVDGGFTAGWNWPIPTDGGQGNK